MNKIMIVDDDDAMLTLIAGILSANGYATITVNDGNNVLQQIEQAKPDLLLLDVFMPNDGVLALGDVRQSGHSIPVIAMSGGYAGDNHLLDSMKELGANASIRKPIDFDELLSKVNHLLTS